MHSVHAQAWRKSSRRRWAESSTTQGRAARAAVDRGGREPRLATVVCNHGHLVQPQACGQSCRSERAGLQRLLSTMVVRRWAGPQAGDETLRQVPQERRRRACDSPGSVRDADACASDACSCGIRRTAARCTARCTACCAACCTALSADHHPQRCRRAVTQRRVARGALAARGGTVCTARPTDGRDGTGGRTPAVARRGDAAAHGAADPGRRAAR
mmetsp:Transcript_39152/g.103144  ORF Transcript_39152/g.103144 Transcript_39152/m.103144 type:complete len:215 (-) Transcript_39152:1239-1883(-)